MAGKFNRFKIKKLQINLTNRWLYTLIVFFSLVLVGVFVYAVVPNPGHSISAIEQPSGCTAGQFLKWTDAGWACETITVDGDGISETDPFWTGNLTLVPYLASANTFTANNIFNQDLTVDTNTLFVNSSTDNVGIGILDLGLYKLAVGGPLLTTGPVYTTMYGIFKEGVILGDNSKTCSSDWVGMLRYRQDVCQGTTCYSYFEICMKTYWDLSDPALNQYTWSVIKSFTYMLGGGSDDGSPPGLPIQEGCSSPNEYYYYCTGVIAQPGCYLSEPYGCYDPNF
jgi:hypothetical protein